MKRKWMFICLLFAVITAVAQELTVKKMEVVPMDLSASTQPRNDKNGNPCALVKVQLAVEGVKFEGNVIGDAAFKDGEYWVYMSQGSYMLNIKHKSFVPLFVNFRDYDIKKVEGKTTYVLTLLLPQGRGSVQMQKLTINYTPATAMVIIDSTPHQSNGHLEVDLPVGSHNYQIVAVGYASAEGSVKLNADMPRTVTEHLVPKGDVAQQQQTQVVVQQPVQQQPVDEFEGKTAQQIADIGEDYFYGRNGKTQDYAKAVKWYRKAADQGNSYGQFRLGICYGFGLGVTQDHAEETKWHRKAAEQGQVNAQFALGYCYEKGEGVTKDLDKAREWYSKAAAQGFPAAKDKLEELFGATTHVEQQPQTQVVTDEFEGKSAVETFTVNGVSFNMVRVEGGTFQMGSNESEAYSNEKPVHQVTLSTYSIGETEVTQALWEAVMGTTIRQQRDKADPSWSMRGEGANYPMYYVSWDDCQAFIQKLSQLTGKKFRLPTEAEWEYAARSGNMSRGYKYAGSNTLGDVAWLADNSGSKTHQVKMKRANELGLYDMSGNVWEWCQDWYEDYSSSSQTNPTGPSSAFFRVSRGGSWNRNAWSCRVSYRDRSRRDLRYDDLGLRLAL